MINFRNYETCVRSHETLLRSHETLFGTMKHFSEPWNTCGNHETLLGTMKHFSEAWNTFRNHSEPWNIFRSHNQNICSEPKNYSPNSFFPKSFFPNRPTGNFWKDRLGKKHFRKTNVATSLLCWHLVILQSFRKIKWLNKLEFVQYFQLCWPM